MTTDDDEEFLNSLREGFISELLDKYPECESLLLDYENDQDDEKIASFKRILHNLKGSSQAAELDEFTTTIHEFESWISENQSKLEATEFVGTALKKLDSLKNLAE